MTKGINWFSGQRVLQDHMIFEQDSRSASEDIRISDIWSNGTIRGTTGEFNVSLNGTSTLLNIGKGVGYVGGDRIAILVDAPYNSSNPYTLTTGALTPQSTGNTGVSLANYTAGMTNYVYLDYLETIDSTVFTIHPETGVKHYIEANDGYQVRVTTSNPLSWPTGLTDGLFLARVIANGPSGSITGITDLGSRQYVTLSPTKAVSTVNLMDGAVTGPKISTNAITTTHLLPNAVTNALMSNGMAVGGGGTNDVTNVAITTTGGPVLIVGNLYISATSHSGGGGDKFLGISSNLRRLPDGGVSVSLISYFWEFKTVDSGGGFTGNYPVYYLDNPSAGKHTYYISYELSPGEGAVVSSAGVLIAVELKR